MLIYSKTLIAFLKKTKKDLKEILRSELGLELKGNKFLYRGYFYPINLVAFEGPTLLGYFKSHSYEIGLNKELSFKAKDSVIKDILRHELAHYFVYLNYGPAPTAHGPEYRDFCKEQGWGPEVYKEKLMVEKRNEEIEGEIKKEKVIEKIKKLLSLGSSSNVHEAHLATVKANNLLLKYNLDQVDQDEEEVYVKRILNSKTCTAKYRAIYDILKTFYVSPVLNYGTDGFYLEVVGEKVNVLLAEYIGVFLERELEVLWENTKKDNPNLKGPTSKNSFFEGLAKGYIEKLSEQRPCGSKDIIKVQDKSTQLLKMVYPRLGHRKGAPSNFDPTSSKLGKKAGKGLSFKNPLENKRTVTKLLGLNT